MVPFPDEDYYCFVIDNTGKIHYYEHNEDAISAAANYLDAVIIESKYYGF